MDMVKLAAQAEYSSYDFARQERSEVLLGKAVAFVWYGMCDTHRAFFIKDGAVVYMWDKDGEIRKEFFFGKQFLMRVYQGDQFCFLEYCDIAKAKGRLPTSKDLKNKNLSETTVTLYGETLEALVE